MGETLVPESVLKRQEMSWESTLAKKQKLEAARNKNVENKKLTGYY